MNLKKNAGYVLPALGAVVLLLLGWALLKSSSGYPDYILPGPGTVWSAFVDHRMEILRSTWITFLSASGGLSLSVLFGGLTAIVFSQAKWIRRGLYPLAIFLQTVPIVAVAPIIVLWLEEGIVATMFISFIVSLFPIITNATAGLLNVDNGRYELFRLYRASRFQRLYRLQIPGAMPQFVTGVKIASGMSVLGAVVGEFFCATLQNKGLGRQIFELKDYNVPWMYACILIATFLGVLTFSIVSLIGDRVLLYWDEKKISNI
jgi:NitT/TauT family transport system permease protein